MGKENLLSKVISSSEISQLSNLEGKKTVLIGGCFDILHFGHLTFLQKAKEEGDVLVILLESDEHIQKYKRRAPIHNQDQRALILSNLTIVDYIVMLPFLKDNSKYFDVVNKIKPDVIAVTDGDSKIDLKKQQAEKIGATIKTVTLQLPFSSTTYAPLFRD